MSISLEVLVDTIKERKKDMLGNRALTNELAIDDLMISLGYNKKRDTSVLRLYDEVDWKVVYPTGSRIAVKTFALAEVINEDEAKSVFDTAVAEDTAVVLLTNGEDIKVYAINGFEKNYMLICEYNIYNEMDELTDRVFTSISKKGFDRSRIDEIVMSRYITPDKVKGWLGKYKNDIVKIISSNEKVKDTDRLNALYEEALTTVETQLYPEIICEADITESIQYKTLEAKNRELQTKIEILEFDAEVKQREHAESSVETDKKLADALEKAAKIDELEQQVQYKDSTIEELRTTITEIDNTISNLNESIAEKEAEIEKLKESVKEMGDIVELRNQKLTQNNTSEEIENLMSQVSSLTVQNNSLINQIEKLNEQIRDKEAELKQVEADKEELNNKIDELTGEINKLNTLSVDDYIQQIHDLTEQCNCLLEEKEALANRVKKLQEEIDDLEGIDKKKAQELLDVIQVSDNEHRQYVGVINTELFKYDELHKFVGCVLQKLSEVKGHLAAPYIFDGDMFNIVPNGERKDLMINNKYFDIELNGMGEDEAINKLRIIFSHFDDMIFECKLVGHLEESDDIEYTLDQNIDTEINADLMEEEREGFKINLFKSDDEEEIPDIIESGIDNEYEILESTEEVTEENNYIEPENYLTVVQLQSYFDLLMANSEDNVLDFTHIKYIGTNNVTFKIAESETLDKQLVRCIDAVLAIEAGRGRGSLIKEFKQFDLRELSEAIFKYDTSTRDFAKITASKYCINGVTDIHHLVKILYDICDKMSIDMSDIFVYINTYTNDLNIVDMYGFDENNVIIYDNLECQIPSDGDDSVAIVKGDIFNNIIFTYNSLNIHSQLIRMAVGVKTKYMSQTIASYDDFLNAIKLLVTNAINNGIDNNIICRCTTLDGRGKLVSLNENEVSEEHTGIEVNDTTFYVSKIDSWEIAESLLRLHTDIYNDTSIATKVLLRNNILEFMNNEFYTSEPSLALAIYSFRNYVNAVIK